MFSDYTFLLAELVFVRLATNAIYLQKNLLQQFTKKKRAGGQFRLELHSLHLVSVFVFCCLTQQPKMVAFQLKLIWPTNFGESFQLFLLFLVFFCVEFSLCCVLGLLAYFRFGPTLQTTQCSSVPLLDHQTGNSTKIRQNVCHLPDLIIPVPKGDRPKEVPKNSSKCR